MNTTSTATIANRTVEWSLFLSTVMILTGIIAIMVPPLAEISLGVLVGWLLIFSGIAHLAYGWERRKTGVLVWEVVLGVVYIFAGVYLFYHLTAALAALTVALGIYLFLEAILEFVLSYRLRPLPGWGWLAFDGILSLALAILIWRTWSKPWVIGVLVGISMLFSGISRFALTLAAGRVVDKLP